MTLVNATVSLGAAVAARFHEEYDALPKCPVCGVAHAGFGASGPVTNCVLCGYCDHSAPLVAAAGAEDDSAPECSGCGAAMHGDGSGPVVTAPQIAYLRWVAGGNRPSSHLPSGAPAGELTAIRRALLKAGLMYFGTDEAGGWRPMQRVTEAGKKLLAEGRP